MKLMQLETETQSILDDLWNKKLIPFRLTAHKVECLGPEQYTVRFYDSRLHSMDISWQEPYSFQNAVRLAMLDRVAKLDGPWKASRTVVVTDQGLID